MKILFVWPKYPDTFWSFKHVLKFIGKKAAYPPLGLLTVAAMLPKDWEKKLVDMNISPLKEKDIKWADYVFISAMITQVDSVKEIISCCNKAGVKVVAGGPLFTTGYEEFEGIDHFVLGEAETTLPQFIDDLDNDCAKRVYASSERPSITGTPVPLWELINVKHYVAMPIQYSRGCPFDCEFCDIIVMNGRVPRAKMAVQVIREFRAIYETGFRGSVFIVDDNFIGNKNKVKKELLPDIIRWQKKANYPFSLLTEASLNLADDEDLMKLMTEAGFGEVFVGLETPIEESLAECNKFQNRNRDMAAAVKNIQNHGLQVLGGFIVGFDSDPPTVFDSQIQFIQKTGVVTAMVGILTALPKTRLHNRLKAEGRLLKSSSGNNTDGSLNFVPRMRREMLLSGYQKIIQKIYSPKEYYERIRAFLKEYRPERKRKRIGISQVRAFLYSVWRIGIVGNWKARWYYWKTLAFAFFRHPRAFPEAVKLSIYGLHYRKVARKIKKSQS